MVIAISILSGIGLLMLIVGSADPNGAYIYAIGSSVVTLGIFLGITQWRDRSARKKAEEYEKRIHMVNERIDALEALCHSLVDATAQILPYVESSSDIISNFGSFANYVRRELIDIHETNMRQDQKIAMRASRRKRKYIEEEEEIF